MIHLFDILLQSCCLLFVHALNHHHGESSLVEFIQKNVLSLNSFHGIRKIKKNIIVDSRIKVSDGRRYYQQQTYNQNYLSLFSNCLSEFQHFSHSFKKYAIKCRNPLEFTIKQTCTKFVHVPLCVQIFILILFFYRTFQAFEEMLNCPLKYAVIYCRQFLRTILHIPFNPLEYGPHKSIFIKIRCQF